MTLYNNNNGNERTSENLNQVLVLCHRFVAHKNGACIQNLTEIFDWSLEYLNYEPRLAQDHLNTLSSIVCTLCLSKIGLPSYQSSALIEKVSNSKKQFYTVYIHVKYFNLRFVLFHQVMSLKDIDILVSFTEQMYTYINFELSIVQKFLSFVAELINSNQEVPKSMITCLSRYLSDNSPLKSYEYSKWRINYKNTLYGR